MKVIIAGARTFNDYNLLCEKVSNTLRNQGKVQIVSGTANGADKLGEKFAKEFNHDLIKFPADWDKYGKSAGYIRNKEMANYSDALIAFWDGKSKGTKLMIELAKEKGLKVKVFNF